jgi:hypothetical protein
VNYGQGCPDGVFAAPGAHCGLAVVEDAGDGAPAGELHGSGVGEPAAPAMQPGCIVPGALVEPAAEVPDWNWLAVSGVAVPLGERFLGAN